MGELSYCAEVVVAKNSICLLVSCPERVSNLLESNYESGHIIN